MLFPKKSNAIVFLTYLLAEQHMRQAEKALSDAIYSARIAGLGLDVVFYKTDNGCCLSCSGSGQNKMCMNIL